MLKTLQNFYKATTARAWAVGTGNRYVSTLPTPSAGYLVINPSNTSKREIIEYSATGTDGNGNYVTVITRGVGGTSDQTHSIGEPVRMNLTAELYADVQTEIDALDTDLQTQIDSLVATGSVPATTTALGISKMSVAPSDPANPISVGDNDPRLDDASTTAKGLVEEATAAEIAAGTGTGSTGARLFVNPSTLPKEVDTQEFTSSGTWTKPTNGSWVFIEAWGGGGAGGAGNDGTSNLSYGRGGAGGEHVAMMLPAYMLSSTETVTVGAGGTAAVANSEQAVTGGDGGDTTFGSFLTANGGSGGLAAINSNPEPAVSSGGTGGSSTYNQLNIEDGGDSGATATHAGAGGGKATYNSDEVGGVSTYGGNGGDGNNGSVGNDGGIRGGGGGGVAVNTGGTITSGAGGSGFVRVTTF